MDHGFPLLVDGKTAELSSLHQFLSLVGPCRIDDSLLHISHRCSQSHYIAVRAAYKEQEFRLIVTIIDQPKQAKDFQSIPFNTAIIVQVLKFLKLLTESECFVHSCACSMLFLIGFGLVSFLFSGTLLLIKLISYYKTPPQWATRPCFAIILQSNDESRIFSISVKPKKFLQISIPSIDVEKCRSKVTFRISVHLEISINSEALQANISEAKLSARRETLLPSLKDLISRFTEMIRIFLNSKKKTSMDKRTEKYSKSKSPHSSSRINTMFQSDYAFNFIGSTLHLKLNGNIMNSSNYFKLKKLTETIGEKKNESILLKDGAKKSSRVSKIVLSIDFFEILFENNSPNTPSFSTMKVSLLYSYITSTVFFNNSIHKKNNSDIDCPKYSNSLSNLKIEFNCCQLLLHLDLNDEINEVIISNLSSSYSYSDFLIRESTDKSIDLKGTELPHAQSSVDIKFSCKKNWDISVGSLDLKVTEKSIDFILEKKSLKCLHYLCFFLRKIITNLIDSLCIQIDIQNISMKLVHLNDDCLTDNEIKNGNHQKFEKIEINNKLRGKVTMYHDSNYLDFNNGSNIDDQPNVVGSNIYNTLTTETSVCASTIFFKKILCKISRRNILDFNLESYELYFGELLFSDIYETISIFDTKNEADLIFLRSPD